MPSTLARIILEDNNTITVVMPEEGDRDNFAKIAGAVILCARRRGVKMKHIRKVLKGHKAKKVDIVCVECGKRSDGRIEFNDMYFCSLKCLERYVNTNNPFGLTFKVRQNDSGAITFEEQQ